MTLQRCNGPECPECGCTDSQIVETKLRFWSVCQTRVCGHCGTRWRVTIEPDDPNIGSIYTRTRCPACGGTDTVVLQTRRPIRRHRCRSCGETFKSREE